MTQHQKARRKAKMEKTLIRLEQETLQKKLREQQIFVRILQVLSIYFFCVAIGHDILFPGPDEIQYIEGTPRLTSDVQRSRASSYKIYQIDDLQLRFAGPYAPELETLIHHRQPLRLGYAVDYIFFVEKTYVIREIHAEDRTLVSYEQSKANYRTGTIAWLTFGTIILVLLYSQARKLRRLKQQT